MTRPTGAFETHEYRITLDVYTQATTTNKPAAQSRVIKMIVQNLSETKGAARPQNVQ